MKKVLVTGAAGAVGVNVIKYLLSEGKYEITAMDLRTKTCQKRLKKYRRRLNLVYGDMTDAVLMDALVKTHDVIIHLAGAIPPLADIKRGLAEQVDYEGAKIIVNAINNYNPQCFLIYASSTTVYGDVETPSVKTNSQLTKLDYYSNTKLKIEKLISDKVKNYTIMRLPLVLSNPALGAFMYNGKRNKMVEAISDNDAGYALAVSVDCMDKLNNKTFNLTGGSAMQDNYAAILANVLEIYGLNMKYLLNLLFVDKNFYTHEYTDSDKLNDILEFRSDSKESFYMRLKRQVKGRSISKFFAKPFIHSLRAKAKKYENN